MKKIMIMLALCGALATMSAQTNTSDPQYPAGSGTTTTQQEDQTMPKGTGSQGTGTEGTGTTQRDKTNVNQPEEEGTMSDRETQHDKSGTRHDQNKTGTQHDDDKKKSGTKKSGSNQSDRVTGTDKSGAKSEQGKEFQGDKKGGTTVTTYTETPRDKDRKDRKDRDNKGYGKNRDKDKDRDDSDMSSRDRDRDKWKEGKSAEEANVPERVRTAFSNAYTNAKASWNREGNNFRAMFKNDKDKDALTTIVVYDSQGNILVTQRELKHNNCPEEIEKFCSRDNRIWKVEAKDAPIKYLILDEEETKWFDSKGNRIGGSDSDRDVGAVGEKPYEK